MVHGDIGDVAASPAGLVQSPDEVDVLPEPQPLVEAADIIEGLRPHQERRCRHVADSASGTDACRFVPEVE